MREMTPTLTTGLVLTMMAGLASTSVAAHHSFAMYDRSVRYVFTGVVDSVNPDPSHLQIVFVPLNDMRDALVRDAKGQRVTWTVEMEGAPAAAREGISVNSFPRGTVFSVGLMPLRNGQPGGARVDGLFKCPTGKAPDAGKHCDSVAGATSHGPGTLATPTAAWKP